MKKVLLIALALITCFAAEAQLRTIKPSEIERISDGVWLNDLDNANNIVASSALKSQGSKNYKASLNTKMSSPIQHQRRSQSQRTCNRYFLPMRS